MGILDTFKGVFSFRKESRYNNFLASMTARGTGAGVVVSDDTAMNFTAVWAAIRILSESVAQLPLSVYSVDNQGNKMSASNHNIYNLNSNTPS